MRCHPVDDGDKMMPIPLPVTSELGTWERVTRGAGQWPLGSGSELSVFLKSGLCLRAQSVEGRVRPVSACYRGDYCARKLECFAEQNVKCCYLYCHFRSTSLAWLVFSNFCWDFSLARWASQSSLAEWRQDWARPVSGPLVPDLRSPVCGSETGSQWRCDEAR